MKERPNDSRRSTGKRFRIEATPLSVFLWGFFILFLMAWIFVLGIFVGRGFVPSAVTAISDLKGQIEKLQGMISTNKVPPRSSESGVRRESEPDPKLSFHEKLANRKEQVRKKGTPEAKEDPKPEAQGQAKKEEAGGTALPDAGKRAAELKDGSLQEGPAQGQFTVQLASLAEKEKAEQMVKNLNLRGYPAFFNVARVKDRTFYRVRCGKFRNREEAIEYAGRLEREAGFRGIVSIVE